MKALVLTLGVSLVLGGCAGKDEQLAKCSADDSPVPALSYGPEPPNPYAPAFHTVLQHDCGPMRPVNYF